MYEYVDRQVTELDNGGRFVLWAMRGWAHAVQRGTCPSMMLARGFAGLGALPALAEFHIAMATLNREAREKVALAPLCCKRIAEDEAVLLTLWRDVGLARTERVRGTLTCLVGETAVRPLARAMAASAASLTFAGFDLASLQTPINEE